MTPVPTPATFDESNRHFATTQWSIVLGAGGRISRVDARAALSALCETYWPPLYAFLRRTGSSPADAADTVQGFFALLLERDDLASVHPERGRFRSFLLASLKHFQANERDKQSALKRGGGDKVVSIDAQGAENQYRAGPVDERTPEKLFDRYWALAVLQRAERQMHERCEKTGKAQRLVVLLPYLAGRQSESYNAAAEKLGISEGAVKTAIHRMRREYGELIRAEVAQTVASPAEVDEEIGALFEALRG